MIIQVAIAVFLLLELSNVLALYFSPGTQKGNAMGAFKLWEGTKDDEGIHLLLTYMARWVAGTKLIFILLLVVILIFGSAEVQLYALTVLVFAIMSYFVALSPLMRHMDEKGLIQPEGYSKTLSMMITLFVLGLSMAGLAEYMI